MQNRALPPEVADRLAELEAAKDAADRANEAKTRFIATISHELRTPLSGIIGFGELLLEDVTHNGHLAYVDDLGHIVSAGRHLLALVNELLDLHKIEAGKMEPVFAAVDLPALVAEAVELARPLAEQNHNRVAVTLDPTLARVITDRMKLGQVLINLLGNAAKFTRDGTIDVLGSSHQEGGQAWLRIDVRDSGIGLRPDQLARLFQDYIQADAAISRHYGGTGLGLSIGRQLCRLMGGELSAESTFGNGSTFTVRLPLAWPTA